MGDVPVLPALQEKGTTLAVVEISSSFRGGGGGYMPLGPRLKGSGCHKKHPFSMGPVSLYGVLRSEKFQRQVGSSFFGW